MDFIIQWIDAVWLFVAGLIIHKNHRIWAIAFVAAGMMMMRLQVEFMESIGYAHGLIGLLSAHVFYRGLVVYSCFFAAFFLLAHYSCETKKAVFMAASISMFFAAMFVSSLLMVP